MRFGSVWIGFEKSIQNPIRSGGFHKKVIQTHPKIFGFLWFSVFLDRFAVFIWIGLDLSVTPQNLEIVIYLEYGLFRCLCAK